MHRKNFALVGVSNKYSAAVIVLALLAFLLLALAVFNGHRLSNIDAQISAGVIAKRGDVLTPWVQGLSLFGGGQILLPGALVIVAGLGFFHYRLQAIVFAITLGVTSICVVSLKWLFARPRPDAQYMLGPINEAFAFPSGHTMHATVFYGLVLYLIRQACLSRDVIFSQAYSVVAWLVITLLVAFARVYLGYHWFTDVLAGFLLGVVVLALSNIAHNALLQKYSTGAKV